MQGNASGTFTYDDPPPVATRSAAEVPSPVVVKQSLDDTHQPAVSLDPMNSLKNQLNFQKHRGNDRDVSLKSLTAEDFCNDSFTFPPKNDATQNFYGFQIRSHSFTFSLATSNQPHFFWVWVSFFLRFISAAVTFRKIYAFLQTSKV